ncbi:undecaprenyl-diphosphatase [Roseiarcus fermentans]|uniref:Undecaprenyl-diphosphatase n=1 Tax=Roseiarcus fermentans TaxID=1473586 RepID=A0A366FRL8_9HYPH|nr:undecaprenyl-diphosphate phosphatase [Roseiarcus fermentans]RBP17324.1 undecaprenyl-diphosphatase [Roseiarcus fermentans]
MTAIQAIIMAVLQGVTELFPISSLGHAVILPRLLAWNVDLRAPDWLAYLTVMHLGTAIALLAYFWRDWYAFAVSLIGLRGERSIADRRVLLLVVLATIPAVVIGAGLHKILTEAFGSPAVAAAFLIVNGFLLYFGDLVAGETVGKLDQLNWKGALAVGFAQCFALIPGISRSGSTIVAGVIAGLRHEESARFSFLMGTPIILAANVYEAPKLLREGATLGPMAILSGVVAGIVAYLSVLFLMRYFHKNEFEALRPFAYYCWAAGALFLAIVLFS